MFESNALIVVTRRFKIEGVLPLRLLLWVSCTSGRAAVELETIGLQLATDMHLDGQSDFIGS